MTKRARTLGLILLAALAVRALPALLDEPRGYDYAEYQNVADNLLAGRGFVLDIKAYHAAPTPVVHYSGYERPHLLPVLIAALDVVAPRDAVPIFVGPLLYLLAIALVFDWLYAIGLQREATWVGFLLALQPGLIDISLRPLTEPLILFCIALALWAHVKLESPAIAGFACGLAFLARPTGAVAGLVLGLVYLARAIGTRRWRGFLTFGAVALLGPASHVALNLAYGAPALLTPQNYLWRTGHHLDGMRTVNGGGLYDSVGSLVADRGIGWVAGAIFGNAVAYAKQILSATNGLGYLIPLFGFAGFGLPGLRRGSGLGLLMWMGVIDLSLYTAAWATQELFRFVSLFYFAAVVVGGTLTVRGLTRLGEQAGGGFAKHLVTATLGIVLALWIADAVFESRLAAAGLRNAPRAIDDLDRQVDLPENRRAAAVLDATLGPAVLADEAPVVASNAAWLVTSGYRRPSFILPYDLRPSEWLPFLAARRTAAVLVHVAAWPPEFDGGLADLRDTLGNAGWQRSVAEGEIEVWLPPAAGEGARDR